MQSRLLATIARKLARLKRRRALMVALVAIVAWGATSQYGEGSISRGVEKARRVIRATKAERNLRDAARTKGRLNRTLALIRVSNKTGDYEASHRIARAIEEMAQQKGLFVKDHRAVKQIVEKRGFTGFRSSRALSLLADYLQAHLLGFVTIERCVVSSFVDEYRAIMPTGEINLPDDEFVEIQVRLSLFDAQDGSVRFTRTDRQYITFFSAGSGLKRQQAFDEAVQSCAANLLFDMY